MFKIAEIFREVLANNGSGFSRSGVIDIALRPCRPVMLAAAMLCAIFFCGRIFGETKPVRYYDFRSEKRIGNEIPNTATDNPEENGRMIYKSSKPFESVPVIKGSNVLVPRIDSGWFECEPFEVGGSGFTIEIRTRLIGLGAERGNNGSKNGTIFGMGDGYWSGTRVTSDPNGKRLTFALGRKQPESAIHLSAGEPIAFGVWTNIAVSWDRKTMKIYVNGFPYAEMPYSGDFVKPNWGFRCGFNDAGVGSFVMDIAELAIYEGPIDPCILLDNAFFKDRFTAPNTLKSEDIVNYHDFVRYIENREFDQAEKLLDNRPPKDYYEYLKAELLIRAGKTPEARKIFAEILRKNTAPEKIREASLLKSLPRSSKAPQLIGDENLYTKLLDSGCLDDPQLKMVQKSIVYELKRRGKFEHAEKLRVEYGLPDDAKNYRDARDSVIEKHYVPDYADWEQGELAKEKNRIARGLSPWEPPVRKDDFLDKFKLGAEFFVAPDGKPGNPGTFSEPFGSLIQARDAIRDLRSEGKNELPDGGIAVRIRGGIYEVKEPLELNENDSGIPGSPIMYINYGDERPVFTGAIAPKNFKPVIDPKILQKLPEEARGKVFYSDLREDCGLEPARIPPMRPRGFGANGPGAAPWVDLYIDDKAMQLARYPNEPKGMIDDETAFARTGEILSEHKSGIENRTEGIFRYTDDRHARWTEADDPWMLGYWKHLWAATSVKVETIDTENKTVTVKTGANPYGYSENSPYYAINLLEEIDVPGEWYLDRKNRLLYVYPPENVSFEDENRSKVRLSVFASPFVRLKNVSNTYFIGLVFEEACASGGIVEGGENVLFAGCTFRRLGAWGLSLRGKEHGALSCDISQLGGGGIDIAGGNVRNFMHGNCFVENCRINDLTRVDRVYGPAISLEGFGNRVTHNLMYDSPAHGIRMDGFAQLLEFNEIHSMVYESDDQSGIDMYGNPSLRENIIRYNYWHHIGSSRNVAGQSGIRLDDMISSVLMYGNVFYRSSGGRFGGIQIHGGKNNVSDNNIFIDCNAAFSFSPWGEKRWKERLEKGNFADIVRNSGVDVSKEPFKSRYPDYSEIGEDADRNFVFRNLAIRCEDFALNDFGANVFAENLSLFDEKIDFDSLGKPIVPYDWKPYRALGMHPIPVEKIGLYKDRFRKDVPKSEVSERYVPVNPNP